MKQKRRGPYIEHDRRLSALSAFVESYEDSHGAITDEDVRAAARRARSRAVTVRSPKTKRQRVG